MGLMFITNMCWLTAKQINVLNICIVEICVKVAKYYDLFND